MKLISICILFLSVCGSAIGKDDTDNIQSISPQQLTAHDLLTYCSSSSLTDLGRQRQRYCWGFISGVEETMRLRLESAVQKICVPKGVSSRNLAKVYIKYSARRDVNLAQPAAQIVNETLIDAYSCLK